MSIINKMKRLKKEGKINPPSFVIEDLEYLVIMGSVAYGVNEDYSDLDLYGFCIPPKEIIFPHLNGQINGFGPKPPEFNQWQLAYVEDKNTKTTFDFSIYNVVKFIQLIMENNPTMLDSLFVPDRCILYQTEISKYLREKRFEFIHKGCYPKFKGYAYSQLHKCKSQERTGKRKEVVEKFGFDVKFAYHVVRLMSEVEEILSERTLTLDKKERREFLKSIRRGEVSYEEIEEYFKSKEKYLDKLYEESTLPYSYNEKEIKQILVNCLEMKFGSIDGLIKVSNEEDIKESLRDIQKIIGKYIF